MTPENWEAFIDRLTPKAREDLLLKLLKRDKQPWLFVCKSQSGMDQVCGNQPVSALLDIGESACAYLQSALDTIGDLQEGEVEMPPLKNKPPAFLTGPDWWKTEGES